MDLQTGLRGANWSPDENMHLTLVFLGAVDRRTLEDVDAALLDIAVAPFELTLKGVGFFGGREARLVYAGVEDNPALRRLQSKCATAIRDVGVEIDARKFAPHVTLGRLNRREVAPEAVEAWVQENALFSTDPFRVTRFTLFRSDLTPHGPIYEAMAEYPLAAAGAPLIGDAPGGDEEEEV